MTNTALLAAARKYPDADEVSAIEDILERERSDSGLFDPHRDGLGLAEIEHRLENLAELDGLHNVFNLRGRA